MLYIGLARLLFLEAVADNTSEYCVHSFENIKYLNFYLKCIFASSLILAALS